VSPPSLIPRLRRAHSSASRIPRIPARSSVGVAVTAVVLATLASSNPATTPYGTSTPSPVAAVSAQPYGPDTCTQGYVWREAQPDDHICVTPETRQATRDENALAASRREPTGGAYGPNTCKPGFVWREAFPGDQVCVPPDRRNQATTDTTQASTRRASDAPRPGTHTVVLKVDRSLPRQSTKVYECHQVSEPPLSGFPVGWTQYEIAGGDPCGAQIVEVAVHFDEGPLNQVPEKIIDRAVLAYDEAPAEGCFATVVGNSGFYTPIVSAASSPGAPNCWRSGSGLPEPKPNGCVAALGFPTVDWTNSAPAGLLPHKTYADVKRTTPREWDVTVPYIWQYDRTAPLGASPPPRFGFLLKGGIADFAQLTGEDSTSCGSMLSNLQLAVTYTVPPAGTFRPPR
jgi:hypothetical protein